ncbi:MAG: hypothetical protein AB8B50_02120 [Pirellulaceae bacterium]
MHSRQKRSGTSHVFRYMAAFCNASLVVVLLASIGCSGNPRTYPVQGKVQFDNGRPVLVGVVEFQSIEGKINARGDIARDGTFTLTTFESGDGAVAGKHKCVVMQMVMVENVEGFKHSTIGVVDPRYASYRKSGLEVDVAESGDNPIVLKVKGIMKNQPAEGEPHSHKSR